MLPESIGAMVRFALPLAEKAISAAGAFQPIGLVIDVAGSLTVLRSPSSLAGGTDLGIAVRETMAALQNAAQDPKVRALGLCGDSSMTAQDTGERRDAMRLRAEERDGTAVTILVPYTRDAMGHCDFGEMQASRSTPVFFSRRPS